MPPEETADASEIGIGSASTSPGTSDQPSTDRLLTPESDTPAPSTDAPDESENGSADEFDWSKADFRRGKPEDVPEQYRDAFAAIQNQFKQVQGDRTREIEDIRRREQALEQGLKRLETLESRFTQNPQSPAVQTQAAREERKVSEMLTDPNIDQDTRNALLLMQRAFREMMDEQLGDKLKKIDEFGQVLPQIQTVVGALTQRQQNDHLNHLKQQVMDAKAQYGDDVDAFGDEIRLGLGLDDKFMPVRHPLINRATGKPHTVQSLYELYSGKTAIKAQEARSEDQRVRTDTKRRAQGPRSSANPPPDGLLSESEVRAKIRDLGFGAR